jgi:class 3 adenylate cyclase
VALVGYPVVVFTRGERRRVAAMYAALAVVFVATQLVAQTWGPLVHEPRVIRQAHFFHLFFLSAVVGFSLHYYKNSTVSARAALDAAHLRIAELLDEMLPPSIAARLQHGERVIADIHGEASVLFADLTGSSALTRRLSPPHLVEVLNLVFTRFDEAAMRHGIEKIKTIGDCYMAATGVLDDERGGSEIDAMAEFALEMLSIVDAVARELGLQLGIRIGISSGAVVSGVIGTRRYNFDVWGDTVNLASQMENAGVAGRIQVSEATYWRLQRHYRFEPRGELEVKSGLRVPAYLLLERVTGTDVLAAGGV